MKYYLTPVLFFIITVSCWQHTSSGSEEKQDTAMQAAEIELQGIPFSFDTIPFTDPEIASPGRGVYQWIGQNRVAVPYADKHAGTLDVYYRFTWNAFENAKAHEYNWNAFDEQINSAINKGQKFSFCIMPTCVNCRETMVDGASIQYPVWLHIKMQGEAAKDWITPLGNMWEPNWNSDSYLDAWKAMNAALGRHIDSASYKGIAYKNVIYFIDASGFGNFGEWQNSFVVKSNSDYPDGTQPNAASLDSLISYQLTAYNNFWLVALPGVWDGNQLHNTMVPPEVGYWATFAHNNAGPLGYRRDNFGSLDNYIDNNWGINNPTIYNKVAFDTVIRHRYKYAPVTGEPIEQGTNINGCDYGDLASQVRKYHATSFGNGNYSESSQPCMQSNIAAASKISGYRLQLREGSISSSSVSAGDTIQLMLRWGNTGIAPTYENWNVQFELRDSLKVLQTWTSSFSPKFFLPGKKTVTDHLMISSKTATGPYKLFVVIRDPNGYRQPLPLANKNPRPDGSYFITGISINTPKAP